MAAPGPSRQFRDCSRGPPSKDKWTTLRYRELRRRSPRCAVAHPSNILEIPLNAETATRRARDAEGAVCPATDGLILGPKHLASLDCTRTPWVESTRPTHPPIRMSRNVRPKVFMAPPMIPYMALQVIP